MLTFSALVRGTRPPSARLHWPILDEDTDAKVEGAGAVPSAGLMQERDRMVESSFAIVLCDGDSDVGKMATMLTDSVPAR